LTLIDDDYERIWCLLDGLAIGYGRCWLLHEYDYETKELHFKSKLQTIPTPRLVDLYNMVLKFEEGGE
jgi:hypothetical protein